VAKPAPARSRLCARYSRDDTHKQRLHSYCRSGEARQVQARRLAGTAPGLQATRESPRRSRSSSQLLHLCPKPLGAPTLVRIFAGQLAVLVGKRQLHLWMELLLLIPLRTLPSFLNPEIAKRPINRQLARVRLEPLNRSTGSKSHLLALVVQQIKRRVGEVVDSDSHCRSS